MRDQRGRNNSVWERFDRAGGGGGRGGGGLDKKGLLWFSAALEKRAQPQNGKSLAYFPSNIPVSEMFHDCTLYEMLYTVKIDGSYVR